MRNLVMMAVFCGALVGGIAAPAVASLKYYPDPVYKLLNDEDHSPMEDILALAKEGDVRAQFIMGDLHAKGKGGMPKDIAEAKRWFEESGMHGYGQSFIRLAAIAKREKKPAEAWMWYSFAIKNLDDRDVRNYAINARKELTESAKLGIEEIRAARQTMDEWEDKRDERLKDERNMALAERDKKPDVPTEVKEEAKVKTEPKAEPETEVKAAPDTDVKIEVKTEAKPEEKAEEPKTDNQTPAGEKEDGQN